MDDKSEQEGSIREAVGIFITAEPLRAAMNELLAAGIGREQQGLLASEQVVEQSLGDLYSRSSAARDDETAPAVVFMDKSADGEAAESVGGSLFFVGTTGVMGAVVASSAVLGGALFAAIGGAAAVGVVGALVGKIIHQDDADYLQQQVDEGHILLFVRLPGTSGEAQVLDILSRHSGMDAKMYDVPVERG